MAWSSTTATLTMESFMLPFLSALVVLPCRAVSYTAPKLSCRTDARPAVGRAAPRAEAYLAMTRAISRHLLE